MNIPKKLLFLLLLLLSTKVSGQETISTNKIYQLREYKLNSQYKDIFLSNFSNHTTPIMENYGFSILSTWTNNDNFYYLLQWDNADTMNKQWELFKSDKEWSGKKDELRQKYEEIVQEVNEQVLTNTYFKRNESIMKNNGFTMFNIGDIKCFMLSDGFVSLPVQPFIAPHISKEIVSKELNENFRNDDVIDCPINILLLKVDKQLILIDAGQGFLTNKNAGKLIGNLQSIGITPNQITDIIISHAHPDHIDGLIDANGKSIYNNAIIHISRIEYEFWGSLDNDFGKAVNNTLSIIKPQLKLFEDGAIIYDCIKNDIVAGHSAGHVVCTIFSEGNELIAINDLVLDELIISHPNWGSGFDGNFEQAQSTRIDLLQQLSKKKSLVWGSHLPYPGMGYIKSTNQNNYKWIPKFISHP